MAIIFQGKKLRELSDYELKSFIYSLDLKKHPQEYAALKCEIVARRPFEKPKGIFVKSLCLAFQCVLGLSLALQTLGLIPAEWPDMLIHLLAFWTYATGLLYGLLKREANAIYMQSESDRASRRAPNPIGFQMNANDPIYAWSEDEILKVRNALKNKGKTQIEPIFVTPDPKEIADSMSNAVAWKWAAGMAIYSLGLWIHSKVFATHSFRGLGLCSQECEANLLPMAGVLTLIVFIVWIGHKAPWKQIPRDAASKVDADSKREKRDKFVS